MNIGLVGLEKSGKTTIFNALTESTAEVAAYKNQKNEPNIAVVDVIDERIKRLSEMYNPKKTVFATIEFIDFAGLTSGSAREGIFSGESTAMMKTCDALAVVIRNFNDELLDGTIGPPDPRRDIEDLNTELVLSDLIITERRLEKIAADMSRGRKTPGMQAEEKTLVKIREQLDGGRSIRDMELSQEEEKHISGFQFLTQKPLFIILNSDEHNYGQNPDLIKEISAAFPVIEFAGNFEMELSQLDSKDAEDFMQDMGIEESARDRLTAFAYDILGYISFFTVGEDEVRAWTLERGASALDAADTIHSDLARGFIRAECFHYDELMEAGSEKELKSKGKIRLEGKEYKVRDGEIVHIRFSV
jgi:hypothetical protein